MTGPRGPTEGPLDLRAVEVLVNKSNVQMLAPVDKVSRVEVERLQYDLALAITALLAHCRALRAALDSLRVEATRHYEYAGRVSQALLDELERAAAVLAQATDE